MSLGGARGGTSKVSSTNNKSDKDENFGPPGFIQYQDDVPRELRSGSMPYKRAAAEGAKYYYFEGVKRGDVGQPHYVDPDHDIRDPNCFQILPADL
ncbi:MAG: hypothetical protein M1830_006619, partial [Pleopsidium flavum]